MATFFGSPPFPSHPISRTNRLCSSPQAPPPQQPTQPTPSQKLSATSAEPPSAATVKVQEEKASKPAIPARVESTDWIASTLTRRFGLGAGLAWVGFLAVGVISEQIKTRLEVSQEAADTRDVEKEEEVILPNGIRYYDLRVGGGASPRPGDLVVLDVKAKLQDSDEVLIDTFGGDRKPLALVMGSRPYSKGICDGVENVLRTMKAGGKRRVIIPPNLCFGEEGADLGSGVQIPPSATLEYIIEIDKVSIAPA
ncbi:peptidyl-prolyl cis-trans isomerase FKBP17-2, chloroplastic-like [Coffea arabica]|uniref:peptidylprolyl isomerase n=1 Tax=Coffea arabica TaxID=13443 RepID=A0A6P6THQ4_COFAR|nr:peptidyl-prolyl cis-trans isomerase FKBP17-2, chloroplastic-like [Coffea arabica]